MAENFKHYLILNLTVITWGFTGILGKEISLDASEIVFFRTGIAFISLILIGFFYSKKRHLSKRQISTLLITGIIVGLHWLTFFYSIKISKVSIDRTISEMIISSDNASNSLNIVNLTNKPFFLSLLYHFLGDKIQY